MKSRQKSFSIILVVAMLLQIVLSPIGVWAAEETLQSPTVNGDGEVTFNFKGSNEVQTDVHLRGNLTDWDEGKKMTKGQDDVWSLTLSDVEPGDYEYKFYYDGVWVTDPLNEKTANGNSVVSVPGLTTSMSTEVEAGQSLSLEASFLKADGTSEPVQPNWSLKEQVAGVTIENGEVITTSDATGTFTLLAQYNNGMLEHTVAIQEKSQTYTYTINYFRYDQQANSWNLWLWEDGQDGGSYGFETVTEDGFAQGTYEIESKVLNILPRLGEWEAKDMEVKAEIPSGESSVEVWLVEGDDTVYYSKDRVNTGDSIQTAYADAMDAIYVHTSAALEEGKLSTFTLRNETEGKNVEVKASKVTETKAELTLIDGKLDVTNLYSVNNDQFSKQEVTMRKILDDPQFYYSGVDLGLTYSNDESTFKVWAPTATSVSVSLYDEAGTYNENGVVTDHSDGEERIMKRSNNGVWDLTVAQDLAGSYYMYKVEFADGTANYVVDPYARAVAANGQRTAVVPLEDTNPSVWNPDEKPPLPEPTDTILYEMQIRDFSIDEQAPFEHKGKYLAFTEEGLTDQEGNTIGIDHLKELGVTTVHLLPAYDFKTVNERTVDDPTSNNAKYNWGYDPQNYNVPEGSFATDPNDPSNRITEFKQMVQALHDNDIRVVMDVVYNHTFEVKNGPFNKIVPGYFYRKTETGKLANGSGVGNEVASERPMVRKYIKDSVRYWAEEYNVDGFRFDLMGLIDTPTMKELTDMLHDEVDPSILIYGEPWQAGGSVLPANLQTLKGSQKNNNFAVFNDNFRNAIKGGSDDASKGFATGASGNEEKVVKGVRGAIDDFTALPSETINYVTAHDNLNLWDKIVKTQGLEKELGFLDIKDGELQGESAKNFNSVEEAVEAATPYKQIIPEDVMSNETVKRSLLANGIVLLSQGIPFIHEGAEMLRSKYGDHNSYKSPDAVNAIQWENKAKFTEVFDYYKGLTKLRSEHPAFRMTSAETINQHLDVYHAENNVVAYTLNDYANNDTWNNIVVIYNANDGNQEVNLPSNGDWNVVVNDKQAGTESLNTINGNTASVSGLSMMVLYDEEQSYTPTPSSIQVEPTLIGLEPGDVRTIKAKVLDQKGNPMAESLTLSSSDDSVVKASGLKLEAISNGEATIQVQAGDLRQEIAVKVDTFIPSSITLTGDSSLYEGKSTQLMASVNDQFEQKMRNPDLTWSSDDPSVASVNAYGEVTGHGVGKTTITVQAGDKKATMELTVKEYKQKYVQFTYEREDGNYDGWNLWTWQTGVEDGEKIFERITEAGARTTFEISPEATSVGFIVRRGNWEEKDYGGDRYIPIHPDETLTKVHVTSGEEAIHVVPAVTGPKLEDGEVTFYYRDPERYKANGMGTIDNVQVKVGTDTYDMMYDSKNEYYTFTLEELEEGTINYTFLVHDDGKTAEVKDPYNESSSIEYSIPDFNIDATITPETVSYDENAVLHIEATSEEDVSIEEAYVDETAVGGDSNQPIDIQLMRHTISISQSVAPGQKTLPIKLIDEFGNAHNAQATVTVVEKEDDDFDWDESRIYFMLTDRFHNGDSTNDDPNGMDYDTSHPETYHGGDFQGIIDKLDYLEELGINTIWITPIVDNIEWDLRHNKDGSQFGYHGYWAEDFTSIDEHLGDLNKFKELIDKAHDRDMKIMVDVVLNHAGYGMNAKETEDIKEFPTEKERSVFEGMLRDGGTDVVKGELAGLPDFRTEDENVRNQLIQWQADWIEQARTERGDTIDYFRVDTVKHVEDTTWKAFKNELTKRKPDFKLIGEYYGGSSQNTGGYLNDGEMDSLLDFDFKHQAERFVKGDLEGAQEELEKRNSTINDTYMLGQFLSSHDEDGFLATALEGDRSKFKVAATLQITAKGQPVIYYGEELGLSGKSARDMDKGEFSKNRYDMDWSLATEENDLLRHYQSLLHARDKYSDVFSKGTRSTVAGGNDQGYLVFQREYKGDSVLVGLNTTNEAKEVTFHVPFEANTKVEDIYSNQRIDVTEGKQVTMTLPSRSQGGTVILGTKVNQESDDDDEENGTGKGDEQEEEENRERFKPRQIVKLLWYKWMALFEEGGDHSSNSEQGSHPLSRFIKGIFSMFAFK
ncbi:alpha-dextrin endo-1,6-alpha-glucosidase [Pontibacillus halophilus JSM 076056 = DSM 19796]|uniref:pullulanase n=1 Tax=Pontibacillus halophilus JSM 076056 = DSM 19796 TaxID=1385510 RepID=A0A0A5GRR3_9BACI|nr:type I pullulanase [Pontibacillus halophilus]KGX93933.1 alpha-dextrin endo-1,6-alpha-glucosidase [Pontibacillus halophilus JSM 076056 = DSM 19796]